MKTIDVLITAQRDGFKPIEKTISIDKCPTEFKTIQAAKLKFMNEYINRDGFVATCIDLTQAKK